MRSPGSSQLRKQRTPGGVSGSQLYHYFDSKQALIRAVITRQADSPLVPGEPLMGDLDELSMALLTALQGGSPLSQTLRSAEPMRAAMNSALAYVRSVATT